MMEFIQAIDWQSFYVGVITTIIVGGCGAVLLGAIGEGL